MTRAGSAAIVLHRPCAVAEMLDCSEWWIKEQARRRRIPYSWIGGSYRFTAEHIAEIIRLFEVRPAEAPVAVVVPRQRDRDTSGDSDQQLVLKTRAPRRARIAAQQQAA